MSHKLGSSIEIGAIFQDRYKIQQPLSSGGFGVVYKAEQLTTGQAVAIKCLQRRGHTPAEHEKILARFRRETRLCAKLYHPNIVRLIDSGQCEDDLLYTVFEYVPGKNLRQVLAQEGRLVPAEAKHLMGQVLDALSCAHDQGIIHRDLKPANIMVVPTGARRNALVLDFGIGALSHEMQGADYDDLTTTMGRLGTPAYSSPEQLRGHDITPHSDLYSWGLVFLECLTGQRAIQGGSVAEIMHRQLSPDPISIPQALRDHCLNTILRITTAKNVAYRRISTARILAQLEGCDVSDIEIPGPGTDGAIAMQDAEDISTLALPETPSEDALLKAFSSPSSAIPRARPAAEPDSQPTGRHQLDLAGERRHITIVSCSLNVIPTGAEALDIEEQEELLAEQVGFCADLARLAGSYIAGESDDHVTLYYGYPKARGDDARRALRMALAIVGQFESRDGELQAGRRIRAEVRIGVHSGMVIIKPRQAEGKPPRISGNAPRIAAQLASTAAPNTVVVSAMTRKLVRNAFELEALEPRSLRGLAEPLEVFRAAGAYRREDSTTFENDSTPLVGRQEDLAMLERHWNMARSGQGQAVLISGDAGIGKSRVIRELSRRLRRLPLSWLECRCMEDSRNSALRPVIELIERQLGYHMESSGAEKARTLELLLTRRGIDAARAMPVLAPLLSLPLGASYAPLDVSPQRQRELTLSALVSLLVEMSADEPLILVIEDVHWADASTIELVTMLLGEVTMAPLLLLLTARSSFAPPWSNAAISMMRLDRLGEETMAEMIEKAAGETSLPDAVIAEIVNRTEGVPLFIEEMVQAVLESGTLEHIPTTLRDLLMARLDGLGDGARSLAQLAAVLGRELSYDLLLAVSELDDTSLRAAMTQLTSAGLMHHRRRMSGDTYVFKHALIQDAAYDSLPRSTQQHYHRLIAQVIEERFSELAGARPDLLARHFAGGGDIARALELIRGAALEALGKSANLEALGHAKQAIGWLSGLDDERERAEMELSFYAIIAPAMLGTHGHGHDEFARWAERAEELMKVAGDSPYTPPTLWGLWLHQYVRSRYQEAERYAREYVACAERSGDPAAQVAAYNVHSTTLFYSGRLIEAQENARRSLDGHRPEMTSLHQLTLGHDTRSTQQGTLGQTLWLLGYPDQGRRQAEDGLAFTRGLNHPMSTCFSLFHLAHIRAWDRDLDGLRAIGEELGELGQRHGMYQWMLIAEFLLGAASLDAARGQAALDQFRAAGQSIGATYWAATIAESEAAAGNFTRAIALCREAIEIAERGGEKFYHASLHYLLGGYLLAQDQPDRAAAEGSLRRAIEIARGQQARMPELQATTALCRLLSGTDAHEGTRDALASLYAWFDQGFDHPALVEARALLEVPVQ
jgi:TOMM system kinase/cyclase fusion protein